MSRRRGRPRAARKQLNRATSFGALFMGAGALHFAIPEVYAAIVPDWLPARRALVYASGVAELAGGAGMMCARTRRLASCWSIATLVAVFPANVHMALNPERYRVPGGRLALWARLPVQGLFIAWAASGGAVNGSPG